MTLMDGVSLLELVKAGPVVAFALLVYIEVRTIRASMGDLAKCVAVLVDRDERKG